MIRKLKNFYHLLEGIAVSVGYGFPKDKLKIIGVTGTDGKTTTTFLIYHILKSAGKKVSLISTVYAKVGKDVYDTGLHVTTPHVLDVYKYIRKSIEAKDEYFVLETTSHALDQKRAYGVPYEVAVITNVTHEHLDYHKTYENYLKTKAQLLLSAKTAIINKDDQSYEMLNKILKTNGKSFLTYGLKSKSDYKRDLSVKMPFPIPEFNKYNYLAAYAVCDQLGIDKTKIVHALQTFKTPRGRMEVVYDKEFKVIVDFAHTPNAIYGALQTVKENIKDGGKIIHVFGAAGKRDPFKRPMMGKSSSQFADYIILTEEDYRTEDPKNIADQIADGIGHSFTFNEFEKFGTDEVKQYTFTQYREQAIKKAVEIAKPNDVIIITGKGHEKSLARGNREYPWNDIDEVNTLLKK